MTTEAALGRWPVMLEVPVAWGDMDAFAHVNNTVYLRWFESARIAYFEKIGALERMKQQGVGPILARATIDYRLPVVYPDRVKVSATVLKLGNTSFVMGYRASSQQHGDKVVAEGEGVIVMVDYRSGQKVALDEVLRAAIAGAERAA